MSDRFRILFEHSSDPHLIFDAEGGISDCNRATVDLIGAIDQAQVLSLHPGQLSPERQPCGRTSSELAAEMDGLATRNGVHRFEWMHQKLDGTPLPVEVTLNAVEVDGRTTMIVVWHDLSERKRVDAERKLLTDELARSNRALKAANRELRRDLEAARAAQRALLPAEGAAGDLAEVSWTFRPCETLGGDLFGVFALDESRVGFFVLDVSGHGVESSLYAAAAHRLMLPRTGDLAVDESAVRWASPAAAIQRFNREFCVDGGGARFVTAISGVLDTRSRTLRYANAGHPPALVVRSDECTRIDCDPRLPVGISPDERYEDAEVCLLPGDRIVLYTDCAYEARNEAGEFFGQDRLRQCLIDHAGRPLGDQLRSTERDVLAWCPATRPDDDLTLLGIQVT